jgi:hypothetical protein
MQVTAEEEIADVLRACLRDLDQIEAAFIQDCYLQEPPMPLRDFSNKWGLSAKALNEVRRRALAGLKDLMAQKGITSIADVV